MFLSWEAFLGHSLGDYKDRSAAFIYNKACLWMKGSLRGQPNVPAFMRYCLAIDITCLLGVAWKKYGSKHSAMTKDWREGPLFSIMADDKGSWKLYVNGYLMNAGWRTLWGCQSIACPHNLTSMCPHLFKGASVIVRTAYWAHNVVISVMPANYYYWLIE